MAVPNPSVASDVGIGAFRILLAVLCCAAVPALAKALNGLLPALILAPSVLALGLVVAVAVGIVSGLLPGINAMRMRVVNALRRV